MSIKKRFLFSVGANVVRAALSLLVGLLVARGLGPNEYGNLAYLLGSFWAVRALMDLGMASAFYTFIAQRHRGKSYYLIYLGWLAVQFVVSVSLVTTILPSEVVEHFWLGQQRQVILLALFATFLQNQVWQTVVQVYEAQRQTIRVQMAGVSIIAVHLILVLMMLYGEWLNVSAVLLAISAEYAIAAIWLVVWLRGSNRASVAIHAGAESELAVSPEPTCGQGFRGALSDYLSYCRPMMMIAVTTFLYEIADRWMLQRFGGASQQGFYQVAAQLSTISLLATSSILNIFWKEIAEASERGDHTRVIAIHHKTTRLLVFVASVVSCFLAPWAEVLVQVLLGDAYKDAWPVLFLMLFYPIHQAMGQINGTLFMATARNSMYMKVTVTGLLIGIPISYALIAPVEGAVLPGLEMGAMGLAIKIVGLNIIFVNIQSWLIARHYRTAFKWSYQALTMLLLLSLGYLSRYAVEWGIPSLGHLTAQSSKIAALGGVALSGLVYLTLAASVLVRVPHLAGLDQSELTTLFDKIRALYLRDKVRTNDH